MNMERGSVFCDVVGGLVRFAAQFFFAAANEAIAVTNLDTDTQCLAVCKDGGCAAFAGRTGRTVYKWNEWLADGASCAAIGLEVSTEGWR